MYAITGFVTSVSMKAAAFSSSSPPISPTRTISSVSSSASRRPRRSGTDGPPTGAPPLLGTRPDAPREAGERPAPARVAAAPDDRRVSEPALREVVADLVGERARARDEAHRAIAEDLRGNDPDVRLARRERAGAIRPEHRDPARADVVVDAQHVVGREPLGDADHGADAGVDGLVDRVGGEAGGDEDHRRVRAGLGDRVRNGVEDGHALDVRAAL